MAALYEEALAVRVLAAELAGEDLELSIASETGFVEAVESVLSAIRDAEELAAAASARASAIESRADRLRERAQRLRDVLVGAMATAGRKSLRLPEATVTVSEAPPSAQIINEQEIPENLLVTKTWRKPDMRRITSLLREGHDIPGICLRNMPPKLQLRTR